MARDLSLNTTAEGVESISDLAFLAKEQVDQVQGFLFAKPMPSSALSAWLKKDLTDLRHQITSALKD